MRWADQRKPYGFLFTSVNGLALALPVYTDVSITQKPRAGHDTGKASATPTQQISRMSWAAKRPHYGALSGIMKTPGGNDASVLAKQLIAQFADRGIPHAGCRFGQPHGLSDFLVGKMLVVPPQNNLCILVVQLRYAVFDAAGQLLFVAAAAGVSC